MTPAPVAVVPLRSPGDGKTRLAPALDVAARADLAAAMLADVVAAVRGAGLRVVVAASGDGAVRAAESVDAEVVEDGPGVGSLDGAIEHVRARLRPAALLVVQADLPGLTSQDVQALVDGDDAVVVAPTDDGGTSALLRRPADVIATAYGPASARAHLRRAREAGIEPRIVHRPGLARDVDVVEDLHALGEHVGPATRAVLARLARAT